MRPLLRRACGSIARATAARPTNRGVSDSAKKGSLAMPSRQFSSRTPKCSRIASERRKPGDRLRAVTPVSTSSMAPRRFGHARRGRPPPPRVCDRLARQRHDRRPARSVTRFRRSSQVGPCLSGAQLRCVRCSTRRLRLPRGPVQHRGPRPASRRRRSPVTLSTVALLVMIVAIGAAMGPTTRAAALDPMRALREEVSPRPKAPTA
jgi:hypothetical protein